MALNYTQDILPREGEGVTDEQIAALINASGVTVGKFSTYRVRRYLEDEGLLLLDVDGKWTGPIADAARSPGTGDAEVDGKVRLGLLQLFGQFADGRSESDWIDTTDPARADQVLKVSGLLVATKRITTEHREALYTLAGGLVHSGVTAEDVSAVRDAHELSAIVTATREAMDSMLQPMLSKHTAINAWLDTCDLTGKTAEEVQAYCYSLLASEDGNPK